MRGYAHGTLRRQRPRLCAMRMPSGGLTNCRHTPRACCITSGVISTSHWHTSGAAPSTFRMRSPAPSNVWRRTHQWRNSCTGRYRVGWTSGRRDGSHA